MTIGEKIVALRKKRGWTQDYMAEKLEVHGRHVSRWENNRMRPSIKMVKRIADVLGVTPDELLDNEQPIDQPVSGDRKLMEKFRQLQMLGAEDKAMIFRLIDTLATQQKLESLLATQKARD